MKIVIATGNHHKFREYERSITEFEFEMVKVAIDEIQSLDLVEICEKKAKAAYEKLGRPVITDDSGIFLDALSGLPGPFTRYFQDSMGKYMAVELIRGYKNRNAVAQCAIAFYDGKRLFSAFGEIKGSITEERRKTGDDVFGFDSCFIPEGHDKTYYELGPEIKAKTCHRAIALQKIKEKLKNYCL